LETEGEKATVCTALGKFSAFIYEKF